MFLIYSNIVSSLIIAVIFIMIVVFDKQKASVEKTNLKLITMAAMLVALATVLNQFSIKVLNNAISSKIFQVRLGDFVLFLIGFCCGGLLGCLSGIAADFLNLIFGVGGDPNLFYTLCSVIWCVMPLYLMRFLLKVYQSKNMIYFYLPLTYALTLALISFWNPIILFNLGYVPSLRLAYLTRIIAFPINLLVNSILLIACYRSLHKSLAIDEQLRVKPFKQRNNDKIKLTQIQLGAPND